MSDLYTFNKRSNHVQFFKWLWGVDPTDRYKTMCPYFWSYVVTVLILPFLILVRVFGTWGQDFNKWMLTYKQEQRNRKKKEFLANVALCKSAKEAYQLKKTNCYEDFSWNISYDDKRAFRDLAHQYEDELWEKSETKRRAKYAIDKKKEEQRDARAAKTQAVKDSVVFKWISYTIIGVVGGTFAIALLFIIYKAIVFISWLWVLKWLGYILLGAIGVAIVIGIVMFIYKYILSPFGNWLECRTFNFDCMLTRGLGHGIDGIGVGFQYIGLFFSFIWNNAIGPVGRGIGHGVLIFFDTIHKIYKKQCPMITWED
jgi:hypothetical protein